MNSVDNRGQRVLIVHRYFWPENIAVLPLMLKDVVTVHLEKGHSVEIVCGASANFEEQWREEFGERVKMRYFKADLDRAQTIFGRAMCNFRLMMLALSVMCQGTRRDLMYLVSYPPLLAGFLVNFSRMFRRCHAHIYYLQDNHLYFLKRKSMVRLFRTYNKHIVNRCDAVITLSSAMKAELVSRFPRPSQANISTKIHVIPNYSTDFANISHEIQEKRYDILYAGNHGKAQNLYLFLEMLSDLTSDTTNPPLKIAFFGNGSEKAPLQKYAETLGVNIDFQEPVSREEVSKLMSQTRLGLVGAQPGLMSYAFPSKLAAYNSAGLKALVMCEKNSEMSTWIEAHGLGYVVDPFDAAIGSKQLLEIFESGKTEYSSRELVERSKTIYSKPKYLQKLNELIDVMMSQSHQPQNILAKK